MTKPNSRELEGRERRTLGFKTAHQLGAVLCDRQTAEGSSNARVILDGDIARLEALVDYLWNASGRKLCGELTVVHKAMADDSLAP